MRTPGGNPRVAEHYWLFLLAAQLVLGDLGSAALRGATLSAEGVAFFAISLGAVVASVWLQRRSLLVVGALGCYSFVGYLAFRVFGGTLGFTDSCVGEPGR